MGEINEDCESFEVSVIVPFYNVARYAEACVESLLAQDFTGTYEVLLIDDGSTDGTSEILDRYVKSEHIRVFHKKNGGLSDARNFGVNHACGRLVTFVDGDDVVSPHYIRQLYDAQGARINCMSIGIYKSVSYKDVVAKDGVSWPNDQSTRVLSREQVVEELMYDKVQPTACVKMAPRWVYENTPFPLGMRYEEIRTVISFLHELDAFVVLSEPIYGYVMRSGSITWTHEMSPEQLREYTDAIDIICNDAVHECPKLDDAIAYQRLLLNVRAHSQIPPDCSNPLVRSMDHQVVKEIRKSLSQVLRNPCVPIASKVRFILTAYFTKIYDALYTIYKKKIKRVA